MKCLCILLCLIFGCSAYGQAQPPLVVILLPGTSLQSWRTAEAPNLHRLMATGALAVMNTRTARLPNDHRRETPESAVLTLGAGARAAGRSAALDFLPPSTPVGGIGTTAGELYQRRIGQKPSAGRYLNVNWPAVLCANTGLGYDLRLGDLADALASRHVLLAAAGGAFADGVAAASDGTVSRQNRVVVSEGECLIWDAGSNITAADPHIGEVARQIAERHGRLIVLSPFAGNADYSQGRRLTPVLEWGKGIPVGLLASPSTRRPGLVTSTDFATSVADYFGLRREDFPALPFGDVWDALPASQSEHQVIVLEERAYWQAQGMKILPYAAVGLALWMLLGTALACRGKLPGCLGWGPLAVMFTLLLSKSAAEAALWGVALILLGALLSLRYTINFFLLLPALIVFSLILDMAAGGPLMRNALLGYSAVEGARYYGIGNEATGLLIGSALVLGARLWPIHKRERIFTVIFLATITLLLGSPLAGAKAGGLLISVAAFGTFLWGASGRKWSGRVVFALLALTIGMMGAIAIGDALFLRGAHSHIGEAMQRIGSGGWGEAADIISRKLAVEGRLAWHSAWACPLWGGLLSLGLLWRTTGVLTQENRALRTGGAVALAGCVLFNDAGIVAGALCLIPLWCEAAIAGTNKKPLELRMQFQGQPLGDQSY